MNLLILTKTKIAMFVRVKFSKLIELLETDPSYEKTSKNLSIFFTKKKKKKKKKKRKKNGS